MLNFFLIVKKFVCVLCMRSEIGCCGVMEDMCKVGVWGCESIFVLCLCKYCIGDIMCFGLLVVMCELVGWGVMSGFYIFLNVRFILDGSEESVGGRLRRFYVEVEMVNL